MTRNKRTGNWQRKPILGFILVFYLTMGISKYSQVLYFQQNNGLTNYAISYSAMAVAGAFSFLISNYFVSWGLRRTAQLFLPIYAVGLFLRIIPNNYFVALISGVLAGVGASVVLLIMRSWIYAISDEDTSTKESLVSARYTIMQIASLLATILAGGLIAFFKASQGIYVTLLILASILMGSLVGMKSIPDNKVSQKKKPLLTALPQDKKSGIILFSIVIFLGMTTSLVNPILPAILRSNGLEVSLTSIWMTVFGLLTVAASLFFQYVKVSAHSSRSFLVIELVVGLVMILASLVYQEGSAIILVAFSIMAVSRAGFFIFKEVMEYDMFPKTERLIYLGIAQSGFLVGDALGSLLGTLVFQRSGTQTLLMVFGMFSIISGCFYYAFYQRAQRS